MKMAFTLVFSLMFLVPVVAFLLVFGTSYIFPNFFRSKLKQVLNIAICVFGWLSPFVLFTVGATTHDIWYDYVSAPLFSRYGTNLPGWYAPDVHSCLGEWRALLIAFMLLIAFHVLLFARFLIKWVNRIKEPVS
jgi:hypothetical protein